MEGTKALVLDQRDNVATALTDLGPGETVSLGGAVVEIRQAIPRGHKFAIRPIPRGAEVVKYGQPMGRATADIAAGHHVHVHNLASQRATPKEQS